MTKVIQIAVTPIDEDYGSRLFGDDCEEITPIPQEGIDYAK